MTQRNQSQTFTSLEVNLVRSASRAFTSNTGTVTSPNMALTTTSAVANTVAKFIDPNNAGFRISVAQNAKVVLEI